MEKIHYKDWLQLDQVLLFRYRAHKFTTLMILRFLLQSYLVTFSMYSIIRTYSNRHILDVDLSAFPTELLTPLGVLWDITLLTTIINHKNWCLVPFLCFQNVGGEDGKKTSSGMYVVCLVHLFAKVSKFQQEKNVIPDKICLRRGKSDSWGR